MRVDSVTLKIALGNLAPVDQLLWSVWGFCVLESVSGGELVLEGAAPALIDSLAAVDEQCGVAVHAGEGFEPDPSRPFAAVSSAGVVSSALLRHAREVCVFSAGPFETVAAEWYWDAGWMAGFRARAHVLARSVLGEDYGAVLDQALQGIVPWQPAVSLISSVFKADRFLSHFLNNCAGLAGYREMEHWLVCPDSPGDEHAALLAHARRWPGAVYLNLERDPGLYATWNLACCLARGRYLSNANIDDRRHAQQVSRLASALDARPSVDLASAALRVTTVDNQGWDDWADGRVFYGEGSEREYGAAELGRQVNGELRPRNIPHCMPLWRRGLHGLRGFFNEAQYGPSADWEYWLRCADAGSRYHHTPEPLGLYLKRGDSYWHQDPTARRFDQRILDRYGPIVSSGTVGRGLHALPWQDLSRFVETGNWLGVLLCLVRLNELPDDAGRDVAGARKLAAAYARRYFGLLAFEPVLVDELYGGVMPVLARLQPALLDWLHAFLEAHDQAVSPRLAARWQSLLVDWHLLTGDITPLIGTALMQRRLGRAQNVEHELLRRIHARDPQGFWRGLQRVYRFTLPLQEAVSVVGALRLPQAGAADSASVRLVYFPAYSNKYQELLYWGRQRAGMQVEPATDLAALEALVPKTDCANIVHLHWLNVAFADPAIAFEQAAERFVRAIRGLKDRGFVIYWTVHNRLNHDSKYPEAEARFRAELAGLVDRVYLHHPLLRYQLDWLPEHVWPWLCEHGPYVNSFATGIDRALVRQRLGLTTNERVFLWFGQIRPYKGLEDWLPLILEQLSHHGAARLVVAGRISSPVIDKLLDRYSGQTLHINRFVSNVELQHLACAADFGLLTYRAILTSGAMFHLYSLGLPIIAPDKGALPAYIVPGWNGLIYKDEAELALALDRVCVMSDADLAEYRAAADQTGSASQWGLITA